MGHSKVFSWENEVCAQQQNGYQVGKKECNAMAKPADSVSLS